MVNPIPDDYPRISISMSIDGAADATAFYTAIFGMTERMRIAMGDKVAYAELALGDSLITLGDEFPEFEFHSPKRYGGSPVQMGVNVEDDATFAAALAAGATEVSPIVDQFHGNRSGMIEDPWGHRWNLSTRIEHVDPEEMERRAAAAMAEVAGE